MELVGSSSVAEIVRRNATRWSTGATSFIFRSKTASVRQSDGTAEVGDYHKDSVIGGQARKESIMGGIIDRCFSCMEATSYKNKDSVKGKKFP